VALAGNPNVGKSTLFNALTGSSQHTGNWPGKTVEQKFGRFQAGSHALTVVDLPGTYSLSAASLEEMVARDFLLRNEPSMMVAVVDACNLERNLYLVLQLLELERPLLVALTMSDTAAARGQSVDARALESALGVPVVQATARAESGLDPLRAALARFAEAPPAAPPPLRYPAPIEEALLALEAMVAANLKLAPASAFRAVPAVDATPLLQRTPVAVGPLPGAAAGVSGAPHLPLLPSDGYVPPRSLLGSLPARWVAIKLLEGDPAIALQLTAARCTVLLDAATAARARVAALLGDEADQLLAGARYAAIEEAVSAAVCQLPNQRTRLFTTENADRILTHRWLGIPLFLALMWAVFALTSRLSAPLVNGLDALIGGPLTGAVQGLLVLFGLGGTWVESLLVDGVLGGVGGVLAFVPVLALLYLRNTLLED
jgi:ferrous iron transport protein B